MVPGMGLGEGVLEALEEKMRLAQVALDEADQTSALQATHREELQEQLTALHTEREAASTEVSSLKARLEEAAHSLSEAERHSSSAQQERDELYEKLRNLRNERDAATRQAETPPFR